MTKNAYKNIDFTSLTLRDKLAMERTTLANERTMLAYTRTALTLMVIAGTLVKLFAEWYFVLAGSVFALAGFIVLAVGFYKFTKTSSVLTAIEKPNIDHHKYPQFLVSLLGRL